MTSTIGSAAVVSFPPDFVTAVAAEVRRDLDLRSGPPSPWMTAAEAAEYLRCPVSRVRKLTMTGDLPSNRDGTRRLYHRGDLDAYVRAGGARSP